MPGKVVAHDIENARPCLAGAVQVGNGAAKAGRKVKKFCRNIPFHLEIAVSGH